MSYSDTSTSGSKNSSSTEKMHIPISFRAIAPKAKSVCITGDFNDWDPTSHPLEQNEWGAWECLVPLPHGRHRYVFIIDGKYVLDPNANGMVKSDKGEKTSLIFVS